MAGDEAGGVGEDEVVDVCVGERGEGVLGYAVEEEDESEEEGESEEAGEGEGEGWRGEGGHLVMVGRCCMICLA